MKKTCILLFFLFWAFVSTSCSTSTDQKWDDLEPTYFDDGSHCYYTVGDQLAYSIKTLPFDMMIENKTVPFIKTSFFELHENHGYTGYFVVTLDRNNLSDDDIYWITKYDSKKT